MRQIAEMGDFGCGDFGCGAVTAERIKGRGLRCRDATGAFTPCPTRMGEVGMFTKAANPRVPDYGWGIVSTPNVRWPNSPTAARTWHAVHRSGAESLRALYPGRTRLEFPFAGTTEQQEEAARRAREYRLARRQEMRKVAGIPGWDYYVGDMGDIGWGVGQGFTRDAFRMTPYSIEPGKVILGNVAGSFIPALVDKGLEASNLSPGTKGFVRFGVGVAGVAGLLFMRRNSYVLGASLALFPGFVDAVATWIMGFFFKPKAVPVVVVSENGETASVGQIDRARLQKAASETLGTRVGVLRRLGFETLTPSDYFDLADSSVKVAGVGQPLGTARFRAIGE